MFNELTGERRRQLIDTQQIYEGWRKADAEKRRRFAGSMRWGDRNGSQYLLRKHSKAETSLGRRSPETEAIYERFVRGRETNKERLKTLTKRLDAMAPVNIAMALGRVPRIAARILRTLDQKGLLGDHLFVVGTNALFGYEALAGVHVDSDIVASGDIDLLHDTRRHLKMAVFDGLPQDGMIGLLRKVDKSFEPSQPRGYRAQNNTGYMVDFIRPQQKNVFKDDGRSALTRHPDDIESISIHGLSWLINASKLETLPLDERGYPVRMVVIDPRVFALHKAWVSERQDREPVKARRDLLQARTAAELSRRYLRMDFDDDQALSAVPAELRKLADSLQNVETDQETDKTSPNW